MKNCENPLCNNEFVQFNTLQKFCSWKCKTAVKGPPKLAKRKTKKIPQVSQKRKVENLKYTVLRLEFLGKPANKTCFIDGCKMPADTIEHTRGRKGYADDWARDNNISLYLDVRFWAPCCNAHNLELENNPALSKKYQLSKIHGGKKI